MSNMSPLLDPREFGNMLISSTELRMASTTVLSPHPTGGCLPKRRSMRRTRDVLYPSAALKISPSRERGSFGRILSSMPTRCMVFDDKHKFAIDFRLARARHDNWKFYFSWYRAARNKDLTRVSAVCSMLQHAVRLCQEKRHLFRFSRACYQLDENLMLFEGTR